MKVRTGDWVVAVGRVRTGDRFSLDTVVMRIDEDTDLPLDGELVYVPFRERQNALGFQRCVVTAGLSMALQIAHLSAQGAR